MDTENIRFHPSWFSDKEFYIPCSSNKYQKYMQEETNKVTLSTDELSTKVMTSFELSLQKLVEVMGNTGAYYTCTPFKCNF